MMCDEVQSDALVIRDDAEGVTTLHMNRPSQFNALSEGMLDALQREFDAMAADDTVRCVVLSGVGKAFCAGHDVREMHANYRLDYYRALFARCSSVMQAIQTLPVPVIARVHGVATAAGCQIVASCDLAIASQEARFAVSGINIGLFCATPSVALSRNISPKHAFDMLMTARFIDGATAAKWGLINEVTPADELDVAVASKAAAIRSKSPAAVRYGKSMFYRQRQMSLSDAYDYASDVMAQNMMEDDAREGFEAFLSKRQPKWRA